MSTEKTTLLEFPCEFPLKIMGKHADEFAQTVAQVVQQFAPDFDPDTMELVVADNGIGMEDHVRVRVFDPFFTTKMGRGGTGLGMNIVHGIVTHILEGQITVHSVPGEGTRIRVLFPRVASGTSSVM